MVSSPDSAVSNNIILGYGTGTATELNKFISGVITTGILPYTVLFNILEYSS